MIEGIEKHYRIIADEIINSVQEEWHTAKIEAIFYEGSISFFAEYTRSDDGKLRSFATTMASDRAFRDIRRLFKEAGQHPWGQAEFKLTSAGKISMKWGYEKCDAKGDTIFDEEEYLRRGEEFRLRVTVP